MRVTHVNKCRKSPGDCQSCGKPIEVGAPYKWFAPFRSSARIRHEACPDWKQSELESNDKRSAMLAISEAHTFDECKSPEDVREVLENVVGEIESVVEMYEENISNLEDAWPNGTPLIDEMNEKRDEVEQWKDACESAKDDIEDFDEDAAKGEVEDAAQDEYWDEIKGERTDDDRPEDLTTVEGFDQARLDEIIEEKIGPLREEATSEAISAAEDALGQMP